MLIVMGIVAGLPATALPVIGSIALTVTLVVYDEPPVKPVASTLTPMAVVVPPRRLRPAAGESEIKLGALVASVAVQFNGSPPAFPILICCELVPPATLKLSGPGPAVSTGAVSTFSVTATGCGLPVIAIPPLTAASEIEPVYDPAARAADVTVTVKVALLPLAILAEASETPNQPVPLPMVTVGVIVTGPAQLPMTPMVKLWVVGFKPTSDEKAVVATGGACSVQVGCIVSVTIIACGLPAGRLVTLSTEVIVTVPVYVPAVNPATTTPTRVDDAVFKLTVPATGVVVSHVPPAGVVVAAVAVQFKLLAQAPLAVMVTDCAAGAGCPITPWKVSAGVVAAIAQGACTTNATGIDCGLPAAVLPVPSVPLIIIVPV